MKIINNYQELSKLIFSHFKKHLITNCFLNQEDWVMEIQNNFVYYFESEKNLYLFRKRENFWILNYYLNDLDEAIYEFEKIKKIDMDAKEIGLNSIVIEFVGRNIFEDNYQKQHEFFKELGWVKCIERERFEKIENKIKENQSEIENNEFENNGFEKNRYKNNFINGFKSEIYLAQENDIDKMLELLKKSFNMYYGCIPSKPKLLDDVNKRCVLIAKIDNNIVGILHFKNTDKLSEIRHLAIDKKYQRQGIASELMKVYERHIKTQKRIVWTGLENQAAQGVYTKVGYERDGYVSSVYMDTKDDV